MHTGGMHVICVFFLESTKSMQLVSGIFLLTVLLILQILPTLCQQKWHSIHFWPTPVISLVIHFIFLPFLGRTIDIYIYIHIYICSNPAKTMQLKQLKVKVVHSKFTPNLKSLRSWWNLRQFYPFVLGFFRQTSPWIIPRESMVLEYLPTLTPKVIFQIIPM